MVMFLVKKVVIKQTRRYFRQMLFVVVVVCLFVCVCDLFQMIFSMTSVLKVRLKSLKGNQTLGTCTMSHIFLTAPTGIH